MHRSKNIDYKIVSKWITLTLILALGSCKDDQDTPIPQPVIEEISPKGGVPTMEVTITGSDFSTTTDNLVEFNGRPATVVSSSSTKIVAKVPEGGSTGPVTVTTNGNMATGPVFRYYDIYVLGDDRNSQDKVVIKVWRNGKAETMTDGAEHSNSSSFTVLDNDIYIAGRYFNSNFRATPSYWKNKTRYELPTTGIAIISDIAVVGGNVYLAGVEINETGNNAKFWKNGIGTNLTLGQYGNDQAVTITVYNGDVYVGGYEYNSSNIAVATYWKNGEAVILGNGVTTSVISKIVVDGTDVHIMGHTFNGQNNIAILTYWKNGVEKKLTDGRLYASGTGMVINKGDVLITGVEFNDQGRAVAKVWINDKTFTLTDGTANVYVSGIAVVEDDIIIAGQFEISADLTIPFFAINDFVFPLTPGNTNATVSGIFAR